MLSFKLTTDQIKKLKELHKCYVTESLTLSSFTDDKTAFIKKQSFISNIGASTRIENAVLTNVEIDWVDTELSRNEDTNYDDKEHYIKNKLSKNKERSIEEVAGYRDALTISYELSVEKTPLRESDIKGLHRELMKYDSDAHYHRGNYKTQMNNVVEINSLTGTRKDVLKTADPGAITASSMEELVRWFNTVVESEAWILPIIVEFIFRFLAIHPFQDGNGRLSRILFQLLLMRFEDDHISKLVPYIAVDRNIERCRAEYYKVLRQCSKGVFNSDPTQYNIAYFLEFMQGVMADSLDNMGYYSTKFDNYKSLSNTDMIIYHCFKESPEKNLQTKEIVIQTTFPRRTVIYSLNKLVDKGFLQVLGKGAGVRYKLIF